MRRRHDVSGVELGGLVGCGAVASGAAAAVSRAAGAAEGTSRTLKVSPPFRRGLLSSSRAWRSRVAAEPLSTDTSRGTVSTTMEIRDAR